MSDDAPTTPTAPVTETIEPSRPIATSNSKPYDDDMLEAYESQEQSEQGESQPEPKTEPIPEKAEEDPAKTEEIPPGEKKGDKVEDNFEQVKITKEINGKQVEFSVAEAIKSHMERETFNRDMDRRVTAVTKKERAYQEDQAKLKGKVDKVFENLRTPGGFVNGVRALAKLATGDDPNFNAVEFEKSYFKNLDEVAKINKLPPEQQEAYWAKREADDAKREAARLRNENQKREDTQSLQMTVQQAQQQYGVPSQEFWETYKYLQDNATGEGKKFTTKEDIQIENVIQHAYAVRHETKVIEAGKKLGIDSDDVLDRISRYTINSEVDLSIEDIVQIVKDSGIAQQASPEAVENLNRKAAKSNQQFSQGNSTKKANGKIDGYDSESLDFLYRNQPKSYTRIVR